MGHGPITHGPGADGREDRSTDGWTTVVAAATNTTKFDGRHLYAALTCSPLIFYAGVAAIVYLVFFKFGERKSYSRILLTDANV